MLEQAPRFDLESAARAALDHFGVSATASPLPSERDQNFLLETSGGQRSVLKIANARERRELIDAQQQAMAHVSAYSDLIPRVLQTRDGATIVDVAGPDGRNHLAWMISWLPGVPLGTIQRRTPNLLADLGRTTALLARGLASFDHPAIHRHFYWDLANARAQVEELRGLIHGSAVDSALRSLIDSFDRQAAPVLSELRRGAVHNDLNDYNILVGGGDNPYTRNQHVVGIVDFGDMVCSYAIADLAICVAYALLDAPDPLGVACQIVRAHHGASPLSETELSALFGLVALRLSASACIAAAQSRDQPENAYLSVSQAAIARTLPRLASIHSRFAEAALRDACGLPPVPATQRVTTWLSDCTGSLAPILDVDLRHEPCLVLDLGVASPLVDGDPRDLTEPRLTTRVFAAMQEAGARVAVGRYDEPRLLYTAPLFAGDDASPDDRRTIHLGLDLFASAGTPVHAALPGTVHAFADNQGVQDYGPVILLRHATDDATEFFTLYGHLSRESLADLHVGQHVGRGQRIGTLGAPNVNGGWTPHLHLQLITDTLDRGTDFPGVARPAERGVWRAVSPDPNLIVGIPPGRFPRVPPPAAETLAARRTRLGHNVSIAYRTPVKIVRGWMQYLFDDVGRRYVDAYNNVPHVGHCHPRVVHAGQRQMALLNTNTRYLGDVLGAYAERLTRTLPPPLRVAYFVNSASEANELALRLARAYTGHRDMIVLEAAYHGNTSALIGLSPYKHAGPGGSGAPDWVHVAPLPDDYRGSFRRDDPEAGRKYAGQIGSLVDQLSGARRGLAGFIAESCPSVGGQIVFPPGYLANAYRHVRAAGGVCIADEVQTGLGRIGTHFWAFETQGVVPDIVVMGKPLGNGHPIGAVVTTPDIAAAFDNGMEFFSTFGGNNVSCAIGIAVLDVVEEEQLQTHALHMGERLLSGLRPLADRHALIGDLRGSGLFLGVELVTDRATLAPAGSEAAYVADRMREEGILLGTDGPHHNVIKIRPPMPFAVPDADRLVETLDRVLTELDETV
jgi:4-aminobutyrate aminotransferase-like enzyme/Ser/Thr protein kinase RdoA (MazF antagonist)